jgi:O-antigen chain-terminating methyltransferase
MTDSNNAPTSDEGLPQSDNDSAGSNCDTIRSIISETRMYADVGSEVTPMAEFKGVFRSIAVLVGRMVLYLSSFIIARQRVFNNLAIRSLFAITDVVESLDHSLRSKIAALELADDDMKNQVHLLRSDHDAVKGRVDQLAGNLESLRAQVMERLHRDLSEESIRQLRNNVLDQQHRLTLLLEGCKEQSAGGLDRAVVTRETEHMHDALYLAFEDRFRGTREEIKERLQVYHPYIEKVLSVTGPAPLLDVGCGRGEWLEIMRDNGIPARGLDLNRMMIHSCRDMGFDVVESDVISYLRSLESDSLGAITGFHLIEHLDPGTLISLFDESFRVLKPGGMVIFETPNPENLIVGACNFYYDLTHRNPLPPEPMKFILGQRGFENVEILRLHLNFDIQNRYAAQKDTNLCYDFFVKEQDYSIMGYKL